MGSAAGFKDIGISLVGALGDLKDTINNPKASTIDKIQSVLTAITAGANGLDVWAKGFGVKLPIGSNLGAFNSNLLKVIVVPVFKTVV